MRKSTLALAIVGITASTAAIWLWERRQDAPPVGASADGTATLECPQAPTLPIEAPAAQTSRSALAAKTANAAQPELPDLTSGVFAPVDPRVMKDPEFRQALNNQLRVVLEDDYRDLPKVLGLSAEQSAQLFDMLAEHQVRLQDARWRKPEGGKTINDYFEETRQQNATELEEFLGPSNSIRYKDFRSTLQGRAEVTSVRSELARGWEPMRESQFEPLLAVVNLELQRLNQEIKDLGPRGVPGADPVNEAKRVELTVAANQRILDGARSILSNAQLAALADLYRRQRLQMESEDALNRLRMQAATDAAQGFSPK